MWKVFEGSFTSVGEKANKFEKENPTYMVDNFQMLINAGQIVLMVNYITNPFLEKLESFPKTVSFQDKVAEKLKEQALRHDNGSEGNASANVAFTKSPEQLEKDRLEMREIIRKTDVLGSIMQKNHLRPHPDKVGGFQIQMKDGSWTDVPLAEMERLLEEGGYYGQK